MTHFRPLGTIEQPILAAGAGERETNSGFRNDSNLEHLERPAFRARLPIIVHHSATSERHRPGAHIQLWLNFRTFNQTCLAGHLVRFLNDGRKLVEAGETQRSRPRRIAFRGALHRNPHLA